MTRRQGSMGMWTHREIEAEIDKERDRDKDREMQRQRDRETRLNVPAINSRSPEFSLGWV